MLRGAPAWNYVPWDRSPGRRRRPSEANGGSFSDPGYDGNIGSGFLKRFAVTFDYSHQTIYLQRVSPPPIDAGRFDRSGMWINAATDAYEVKSVAAHSPAAEAGLQKAI